MDYPEILACILSLLAVSVMSLWNRFRIQVRDAKLNKFFSLKCPDCGKAISHADTICPHCGRYLHAPLSKTELQTLAQLYLEKANKAIENGRDLKGALVNCNKVIEYTPDFAEAHNLRGFILDGLGKSDDAILAYQEAIRLDPGFEDAKANLTVLQAKYLYIPPKKIRRFSSQPKNGQDRVNEETIIRQQWIAFVVFILFALAGVIALLFPITNTNSFDMFGVAKYSLLAACISLLYIGVSSIKNYISIARQGGLWEYAIGKFAVLFGKIMVVIGIAGIIAVLYYLFF